MSDTTIAIGIELGEQFARADQQRHAAKLGMWLWLVTELLLFAGLFAVALNLHVTHPAAVRAAVLHLKFWIGAANTAVLISSSFTMSAALMMSRMGWQRGMVRCMLLTATLGALFLVLKGYEYYSDYVEFMTPFLERPYALQGDPASRLFTNLYFVITALHGLHLATGVSIMLWMAWRAGKIGFLGRHQNWIEVFGLYWHFIDLIWIMVFPILYVFGR